MLNICQKYVFLTRCVDFDLRNGFSTPQNPIDIVIKPKYDIFWEILTAHIY